MNCKYELKLRAICPIHECDDVYDATVESAETIYVERLLEFAAKCATTKETQEQITETMARAFPNCRVTTVGYHSNVKTTVTA